MTTSAGPQASAAPPRQSDRLVIAASSLGTIFEWYDFYLYGLLAAIISAQFFSGVNETTGFIFALAAFAAGFAVRPFGAILFGRIGDLVGRKYTFLVTMGIMGLSTFAVGLLPSYAAAGRRRADPAGRAAAAPGPRSGRRIWRRRDLCRRACAGRPPRPLHQLHPDHRDAWPVRSPCSSSSACAPGSARRRSRPGAGGCPSCSRSCSSPSRCGSG